jgi:predicted Na+-dependent transporter
MPDEKDLLGAVLNAMDRLLRMFMVERFVYLILTIASFVLMCIVGYSLVTSGPADKELLLAVFGGSGLIAAASLRTTWFFGKAFSLVSDVVKRSVDERKPD